jgi:ABC-type multidrug transport system fused ATPase/permease subunit
MAICLWFIGWDEPKVHGRNACTSLKPDGITATRRGETLVPEFVIALCPLVILFLLAANYYRASARDIKRYEAIFRSHVFAQFGEATAGAAYIQAYRLQKQFGLKMGTAIDEIKNAYFLTMANQRWLSVHLNAIGTAMVFVTARSLCRVQRLAQYRGPSPRIYPNHCTDCPVYRSPAC